MLSENSFQTVINLIEEIISDNALFYQKTYSKQKLNLPENENA